MVLVVLHAAVFRDTNIHTYTRFLERVYEKGFVGRFPKVLFICVYLYISLLNWFHDSSPEREGGWSPSSIEAEKQLFFIFSVVE